MKRLITFPASKLANVLNKIRQGVQKSPAATSPKATTATSTAKPPRSKKLASPYTITAAHLVKPTEKKQDDTPAKIPRRSRPKSSLHLPRHKTTAPKNKPSLNPWKFGVALSSGSYRLPTTQSDYLRTRLEPLLRRHLSLAPYDVVDHAPQSVDRLTHGERLQQRADQFVLEVDWPKSAVAIVEDVFYRFGWQATYHALKRQAQKGMTPTELERAAYIKNLWQRNNLFWQTSHKNVLNHPYSVLTWPNALLIINSFVGIPQNEELRRFLNRLFNTWQGTSSLHYKYPSFYHYIMYRCATSPQKSVGDIPFGLDTTWDLPAEDFAVMENYDIKGIQIQQKLLELGLS